MILIIDDDERVLETLERWSGQNLEDLPNVHFQVVSSAGEAIDAIDEHEANIVFIDHYLGERTGMDVINELEGADIQFISITASQRAATLYDEHDIQHIDKLRSTSELIDKIIELADTDD